MYHHEYINGILDIFNIIYINNYITISKTQYSGLNILLEAREIKSECV